MSKEEALTILKHFNNWRRNGGDLEYRPWQIGIALDVVIEFIENSKL